MERRRVGWRGLALAGTIICLAVVLGTCNNSVSLLDTVKTDVKIANDKFLIVNEVSPTANAASISPGSTVWIKFDRSIDMATVSPGTIVFNPTASWDKTEYDDPSKTLTITPKALDGGKDYTITVTKGVRGADGSDLQVEHVWKFSTSLTPYGTFVIQNWPGETDYQAGYTKNSQVKIIVTPNEQVDQMHIYEVGGLDLGWQYKTSSVDLTLSSGDGQKTIYAEFKDSSGTTTSPINRIITLDTAAPVVTNFVVNAGAAYAATAAASLTWTGSDATSGLYQMCFSNDTSWPGWEPYAATKAWALLTGDGSKTVSAKFRDNAGWVTQVSDGITLDATPPVVNIGSLQAMNIASPKRTTSATASDATSGIASCSWAKDSGPGTVTFESPTALNTNVQADADGTYVLRLTVKDNAGNQTAPTLTVVRDTVAPSVSIGALPSYLNVDAPSFTANPIVTDATSGVATYSWIQSAGTGSVTITNATTRTATVTASLDGTCTIQLTATDAAENASSAAASLSIDRVAPYAPPVSSVPVSSGTALPSFSWYSGGGGAGYYRYAMNSVSAWSAETTATSYAPTSLDYGSNSLYAEERDAAGNWSTYGWASYFYYPDWLRPAYQATGVSRTPKLVFGTGLILKGTLWDLYGGTNPKGLTLLVSGLTTYSFQVPTLLPASTKYYWQYKISNYLGRITYTSPVYTFATGP